MIHKFLYISCAFLALCIMSCQPYDDTDIKAQIDDLDMRVTELEQLAKQMNDNISSLLTTVTALETDDRIVSVDKMEDGSGYIVTFSKSGPINIYHGHNPVIGVEKDESDGQYYWTLDGEPILDGEQKIPATSETQVPQIRVNGENFELSFDGVKWENIGNAGGAGIFKQVIDNPDQVTFVLSNDDTIVIPKVQSFALKIDKTFYPTSAGGEIIIDYSIVSGDDATAVGGWATGGFQVSFKATNSTMGIVQVTAPETIPVDPTIDAGQVFIFAVNGKGVVSGKVLTFGSSLLTVEGDITPVPAAGGTIQLTVFTNNTDYQISVNRQDRDWISYEVQTKATVHEESIVFTISENTSTEQRESKPISILDELGTEVRNFTIVQQASSGDATPGYYNSIDDWKNADKITF